ncbi:ABC transporter substrate-binding protein [Lachnoclostridium sp. Marseille-P6806]|uniref:ABC transporter substrate-binding protein n=1 Tax=Lachnoclostridium sp. Marseille-P6806 TaxID=2364793 RepID=UPI0010324072|nr:extracellular solute-binding protein [Lachnoclostridium sp. Marseille-P6806]
MKKRVLGAVLSAAVAAAMLAGCGETNAPVGSTGAAEGETVAAEEAEETAEEEPAEAEPTAVTTVGPDSGTKMEMWSFVEAHNTFYAGMLEKWNEENPDRQIQITFTTYPYGDMHQKLIMSLQTGTGAPDLCDVEMGQVPNVYEGIDTWLYPLDGAMAPYAADMLTSRLDAYKGSDGKQYGAPFHVGATVMYWNMERLEAAGITKEEVDAVETWDDYTALGEKYMEAIGSPDDRFFTSVDTGGTDWLWIAMAEYGEDWTGGYDAKANVQLESVRNMLTMQQNWLKSGIAEVSPDGHVDLEAGYQNILDGNIVSFPKAMWFMSRFINYMADEKGKWYITKCPVFEAGQKCSVGIGGTGTVVTQQSEDPALAADFLCYAKMSPEGETMIWKDLGFDVCNTSLWSDASFAHDDTNQYNQFFRNYPYDVLEEIKDQIGMIMTVKISPTINEYVCTTTLNEVLEDGMDVDEALQELQDAVDMEQ